MGRRQCMETAVPGLLVVVTTVLVTVRAGRRGLTGLIPLAVFRVATGRQVLLNYHGNQ